MNGNCQCAYCGYRGERGLDVVLYRITDAVRPACEDCATVLEDGGVSIERLADQSGEVAA